MKKISLINLILKQNIYSKDKIYAYILSGLVSVNGNVEKNPNRIVNIDISYKIDESPRYVSRGAYKLEGAIADFKVDLKDLIILDCGASTGGFTDYCLKNNAKSVIAIDSGKNQLDYSLKVNNKVFSIEKINVKDITLEKLPFTPDIAVCDLSFTSTYKIAKHIIDLTSKKTLIALIKPQFELRYIIPDYKKEGIQFSGVIKDDEVIQRILSKVSQNIKQQGLEILDIKQSKILGASGNKEYFFYIKQV